MSDILIHAEDAGAANFVAPLPVALQQTGLSSTLLASGFGTTYFERRNIPFTPATLQTISTVLDAEHPKVVLVGTSENRQGIDLALIDECRRRNIPVAAVIDMNTNAHLRFSGNSTNPKEHEPNWVLVPDEATQQSYVAAGFAKEQVIVTGHPHYDYLLEKRRSLQKEDLSALREKYGLPDDGRLIVTFVAEPASQINPDSTNRNDDFTLTGTSASQQQSIIALEELILVLRTMSPSPALAVKLHPKNSPAEFDHLLGDITALITSGDPLESVWLADLAAGVGSMLLMEAHLLGKRTASISPRARAHEHWLPCVLTGATPCLNTREELKQIETLLRTEQLGDTALEPAIPRVIEFIRGLIPSNQSLAARGI
jgi:hypothetical protein